MSLFVTNYTYNIRIIRLGVNFNQLPINKPVNKDIANSYRDGHMSYENYGGMPNYNPNSFLNANYDLKYKEGAYTLDDVEVDRHEPVNDNFFHVSVQFQAILSKVKI